MKKSIAFFALIAATHLCLGESIAPPTPRAFIHEDVSSDVMFTMIPASWEGRERKREPFGIAYRIERDGTLSKLYRTKDWYSSKVFVSKTGRYLVAQRPWSWKNEVIKEDTALAFYDNGKLMKVYSIAELMKQEEGAKAKEDYYRWTTQMIRWRPRLYHFDKFQITTSEEVTYTFDVTTGSIIEKSNPYDEYGKP